MAKDPAFLFYTGDFSTGTQFLSNEQLGKYLRLLMAQHQTGHLEEKHMIQICDTYEKEVFSKFKRDKEGLYYNQRLEDEILKRRIFSQSRSKNRSNKNHISNTYEKHMEDRDINKDILLELYKVLETTYYLKGEENQIFFKMIVIEMMNIWMERFPQYDVHKETDYHAILSISFRIADAKGWKKAHVTNLREAESIKSWEKITEFISCHKYYSTLTLDSISNPKMWQKIVTAMKNETKSPQQNGLEEARKTFTSHIPRDQWG